jgi:hypothetical protein
VELMTVWACDWTHWQGKPLPAEQVAAEGFGMVKLKVGGSIREGWSFIDPTFHESAEGLLQTDMLPAAFWYLMPGNPHAQAGLFLDQLALTADAYAWGAYLDIEQKGLTWYDFLFFVKAWHSMTNEKPLSVYTSRRFWIENMLGFQTESPAELCPVLEEARWVPEAVRKDPARPYASQQAQAILPGWWGIEYAGWKPAGIQFTDNALVAGKRTSATKYPGTVTQLGSRII